jgi:hypothetical protein
MRKEKPTFRIFKKIAVRNALHLAHAIAAQTHRDTKAWQEPNPHPPSKRHISETQWRLN